MEQNLPEQPQRQMAQSDDEITLKDIILKIQEWWSIVWPHKNRISAVDAPIYPLQKDKGSAAKAGIFGSVITGFLLVLFFIGRVEAKNIMA